MYSWHAWIVLSESTTESDEGSLSHKLELLRAEVRERRLYTVPEDPVCAVNYDHLFQCSGSHNHRGDAHERLISIVQWIAERLPGSHGLIYWRDDEILGNSVYNGYNVIVVARGRLHHRYDPFLSPTVPNIED